MPRRITAAGPPVAHLVGPGQLKVVNGYLAFKPHGGPALRLDPAALAEVACYGDVSVSGPALDLLFRHGVQTAWLSPAGNRCRGRLARADAPTAMTRVRQHRVFADPAARRDWAKRVVTGKIAAAADAARHYQRHGAAAAGPLLSTLAGFTAAVGSADTADQVRGFEGAASAAWFRFLGGLFAPPWVFTDRTRRPPTDPVNALLSLGYTWLLTRATARAEAAGYEVYVGGLHEYRAGRPSLACDLIEPLRVPAVDRWVVAVCGRGVLAAGDFVYDPGTGGFRLRPAVFGKTLYSWEQNWAESRQDDVLGGWVASLATFLREADAADTSEEQSDGDL